MGLLHQFRLRVSIVPSGRYAIEAPDAIDLRLDRVAIRVGDREFQPLDAAISDELREDVEHVRRVRPARLRGRAWDSRVRVRLQDEELLREATGKSLHANRDGDSITHFDRSAVGRLVEDRAVLLLSLIHI